MTDMEASQSSPEPVALNKSWMLRAYYDTSEASAVKNQKRAFAAANTASYSERQ
jgi:hypothetical protein